MKNTFTINLFTCLFFVLMISCFITTDVDKKVSVDSVRLNIKGNANKEIQFRIPKKSTGFYHINFVVTLPDYDDTIRRLFGVNPEQIRSQLHKPADFDDFWKHSREQLAKVGPYYKALERKDLSTDEKKIYAVEMHSYSNLVIRGWLVIPREGKNFPVHYRGPGYVVALKPNMDNDDFIAFNLNVRGNGNSNDIGTDNYSKYLRQG
jgi:cephalosporin-C deacetylase